MADEFEERLILWAFYLLLVAVVVIGTIYAINRISEGFGVSNKFVNIDKDLLLKTVELSPGKVKLNYNFGDLKLKVKHKITTLTSLKDESTLEIKNNDFDWPVSSKVITSCYGGRGVEGGSKFHQGVDIRADGSKVKAVQGGEIISYVHGKGTSNTLTIDHGDGIRTRYLHLQSITLDLKNFNKDFKCENEENKKTCSVEKGDFIATSGRHGPKGDEQYPPHLHFEIIEGKKAKDPFNFRYDPSRGFEYKKGSNCETQQYTYSNIIKDRIKG